MFSKPDQEGCDETRKKMPTFVPVKNCKHLLYYRITIQRGLEGQMTEHFPLCERLCVCIQVCLWMDGNVGELNIPVVILPKGKKCVSCLRISVRVCVPLCNGWWL